MLNYSTLWTEDDVGVFLGLSARTVRAMRTDDKGPAYMKMGRSIRYSPKRVAEWATEHTQETSQSGPHARNRNRK